MRRKMLEEMELTKEQIDQIMKVNGEDIENAKSELTTITKERDDALSAIKDRDKQLEDLKKSTGDVESLRKQIEDLQTANKESYEKHKAEMKQLRLETAIEKALTESKAKIPATVKAMLDLSNAELDEDGTVKGLADQIKKLQSAEDSKFLFDIDSKKQTVKGATPNDGGDDTPKSITKEQFNRMSYKERVELFNTDRETYNALSAE